MMVVRNPWWISEPEQRYWMEITHRPYKEIGTNLHCQVRPVVMDELVEYVQPGDRILHWKKGSSGVEAAIVGWSEATGPPARTLDPYDDGPEIPCWTVTLGGLQPFPRPVPSSSLLPLLDQLMDLREQLQAEHGKSIYFPFVRHIRDGESLIYAPEGYFIKFPVELFDLVPGIGSARIDTAALSVDDVDIAEDDQPPRAQAPSGRTTRAQDPKLRAAIERRSLDVALAYYNDIDGQNPQELGKPYDIKVTVGGVERHCEVKGSKMLIDTVELTINEVNHPKDPNKDFNMDLIVVDGIDITRDNTTGEIRASGGRIRVWSDWTPEDDALEARKFAYKLPPEPG